MTIQAVGCVLLGLLVWVGEGVAGQGAPVEVPRPDPVLEAWRWQFFTETDGLASVRVNAIVCSDNAVWFATDRGISRYDGMNWRTFTRDDGLPDNLVLAAAAGPDGTLWFGTAAGVVRYDGAAWKTFEVLEGAPAGPVRDLVVSADGSVWAATEQGAVRSNRSGWKFYTGAEGRLANSRVNDIEQGPDGAIWFATERGLSRFDGTTWNSWPKADGNGPAAVSVTSVCVSRDGSVWLAQYGKGLSRLRDGAWRYFDRGDGLPDNQVRRVFETPDGALWVLCKAGIARYDARKERDGQAAWAAYGRVDLPGLGEPYAAAVDHLGGVWISGRGARGVARFDYLGKRLTTFDLGPVVTTMTGNGIGQDRDGALWFGVDQGAFRFDGNRWIWVREIEGSVHGIFNEPDGTLYLMGEEAGSPAVVRVRGTARNRMDAGLDGEEIRAMCRTEDGILWAGAADGRLFRWDERSESWAPENTRDAVPSRIRALCAAPRGGLYVGGPSRTLGWRLKSGLWQPLEVRGRGGVYAFLSASDGSVWTAFGAAGGGVMRLFPDMSTRTYDVQDGLIHGEVHALAEGADRTLWVGTSGGVACFDGGSWTPLDGLPDPDVRALFRARDGSIWMRTASGMVVRYRNDGAAPETVLLNAPSSVSSDGNVGFSWEGRDRWVAGSAPLQFSYRLDGGLWSPFSERSSTPLFALPDGAHTFEIRARDADLNVGKTPVVHRFVVQAPIWKQPWFVGVLLAMLGAIGVQTRRLLVRDRRLADANERLQQMNERLQEVDALKTDFFSNVSHELRTPMTAIKGYVDNMLDGIAGGLNARQKRYLSRIKSNADRLTGLINDLLDLSRIDRGRTDLLQLNIGRLGAREVISETVDDLRPVAGAKELKLTFKGEDALVMADRDRLIQIVTNLVGNAIKFTDAGGSVTVTVKPDGTGYVQTIVQDTGMGIAPEDSGRIFDRFYQVKGRRGSQPGTGLGLPITKELVELQGGRIWVESKVGVGSSFAFTLPQAKEEPEVHTK